MGWLMCVFFCPFWRFFFAFVCFRIHWIYSRSNNFIYWIIKFYDRLLFGFLSEYANVCATNMWIKWWCYFIEWSLSLKNKIIIIEFRFNSFVDFCNFNPLNHKRIRRRRRKKMEIDTKFAFHFCKLALIWFPMLNCFW